ncbi:hypothetical protein B5P44_31750 [Mycobacterium sp. CBMA 213]|nr:hypothetical protein [Mycolicibacterium sp. CBMA 213]
MDGVIANFSVTVGVDEIVLSFYVMGLTTGEIAAHFDELYDAKISADTIGRITDNVSGDLINSCTERAVPARSALAGPTVRAG